MLLIAGTACRPGEALALRRGDIDFNYPVAPGITRPVAHITGTVVYDAEAGGLSRQPHTKGNGMGDRTVVLPAFVAAVLRERMMAAPPNEQAHAGPCFLKAHCCIQQRSGEGKRPDGKRRSEDRVVRRHRLVDHTEDELFAGDAAAAHARSCRAECPFPMPTN